MSWVWQTPIAHRGLHDQDAGRPENSLAALEAAAAAGYPVEVDVRLSGDDRPVVIHDDDLRRLTGAPLRVATTSVARLRRLHLQGTDQTVPTLAAAVEALAGRVPVLVDVKNATARVGPLERAIRDCLRPTSTEWAVTSFNPRSVAWFARYEPAVVRGQTLATAAAAPTPGWVRWIVRARLLHPLTRPHVLAQSLDGLPAPLVRFLRTRGLPVVAWTARTTADLAQARAGADNVIFEGLSSDDLAAAGFAPPASR